MMRKTNGQEPREGLEGIDLKMYGTGFIDIRQSEVPEKLHKCAQMVVKVNDFAG